MRRRAIFKSAVTDCAFLTLTSERFSIDDGRNLHKKKKRFPLRRIQAELPTFYARMMRSTGIMKGSRHFSSHARMRVQECGTHYTCEMQMNISAKSMSHLIKQAIDKMENNKSRIMIGSLSTISLK